MKIKKIVAGLLAMSFVFGGAVLPNSAVGNAVVTANAEEAEVHTYGDFKYIILKDGTAEITGHIGEDTKIKIPAEIPVEISSEIINVPVTSIGRSAFDETVKSINKIESISMPNSITTIRYGAFNTCSKLAEVKLSANLTTIEDYAFFRCRSLNKIEIPESVTSIGANAFNECKNIKKLTLSSNITQIGSSAFANTDPSLVLYCYNGTFAEKYALGTGRNFKVLDVEDKTEFPVLSEGKFDSTYHQFRLKWTEVEGAEEYAIAVKLKDKWRVQKQGIPADTTTYTSPKNIARGKTFEVAIAAKIDGKWDTDNAIKNAFKIYVK